MLVVNFTCRTERVNLRELRELQRVVANGGAHLQQRVMFEVSGTAAPGTARLPVLAITVGNPSPGVPAAGFFGGVQRAGADRRRGRDDAPASLVMRCAGTAACIANTFP